MEYGLDMTSYFVVHADDGYYLESDFQLVHHVVWLKRVTPTKENRNAVFYRHSLPAHRRYLSTYFGAPLCDRANRWLTLRRSVSLLRHSGCALPTRFFAWSLSVSGESAGG